MRRPKPALPRIDPCHGCQIPEMFFGHGGCGECQWQHHQTQKDRIVAWFAYCKYQIVHRSSWASKGVMRRYTIALAKDSKRKVRSAHKRGARCYGACRPGILVRAEARRAMEE